MSNIILRTNPDRFNIYSGWEKYEAIEHAIKIAMRKFYKSNVTKTKAQALFEEIEGYYARNKNNGENICPFETYVQHWTEAHRGVILDEYLDIIEKQFGKLEGPLHIIPGTSSWETTRDWRGYQLPVFEKEANNNEQNI